MINRGAALGQALPVKQAHVMTQGVKVKFPNHKIPTTALIQQFQNILTTHQMLRLDQKSHLQDVQSGLMGRHNGIAMQKHGLSQLFKNWGLTSISVH